MVILLRLFNWYLTSVGRDGERKEAQGRRGEKEETGRGREETVCYFNRSQALV